MNEVTRILAAMEQGEAKAANELFPLVYDELRRLAAQKLSHEAPGQTLQATALVHEAYIRLVDVEQAQHWESRGSFFSAAAEAMRRILVETARRKGRRRHGGAACRRDVLEGDLVADPAPDELLDLDEALSKFSQVEPQAAELVKLHVFAGLTIDEAARALGISSRAGERAWAYARAWLRRHLDTDQNP